MSTRGCVAIKKQEPYKWQGVYNHFDSYPTGLGAELWQHLQGKDLHQFAKDLLRFDDFRNYLNGGKCEYCGQTGFGQAHDINGVICCYNPDIKDKYSEELAKNLKETGYLDPLANYHKHAPIEDIQLMTAQNSDALFIEWVYVIDPDTSTIEVLSNVRAKGTTKETSHDGKRTWDRPNYTWARVAVLNLKQSEPNWEFISATADKLSEQSHDKYDRQVKTL